MHEGVHTRPLIYQNNVRMPSVWFLPVAYYLVQYRGVQVGTLSSIYGIGKTTGTWK